MTSDGRRDAPPTEIARMITATETRSGKTHRDENFPVASRFIPPRHRAPILAFYRFVRAADDVADHPHLKPEREARAARQARCGADRPRAARSGGGAAARRRSPSAGSRPRHALDLLDAFRLDATKSRYADWAELMHYCSLSAMPVGRYVLDVHGEPKTTWPASDAICAALQVINHLQDCAEDFRNLDRVYLPLDTLAQRHRVEDSLAAPTGEPGLRAAIAELAEGALALLREGRAASRPGRRHAARDGDRRHPPPRGGARERADAPRSAVASRCIMARPGSRLIALGARRARWCDGPSCGARWPACAAGTPGPLMAAVANEAARGLRRCRRPAAPSTRRCASCRAPRREAMYAIYAFCRAVDDIADAGGPREPRRAALDAMAAPTSTACSRAKIRRQRADLAEPVRALRPAARGFSRRDRRHGDGRRRRHPRAGLGDARPLLRPRRERRRPPIGPHLRPRAAHRRSASRIISAARCSSPTSCATSTRTRRWAGSICRARRSPPPASKARAARPPTCCWTAATRRRLPARSPARAESISTRPTAS